MTIVLIVLAILFVLFTGLQAVAAYKCGEFNAK